MLEAVASNQDLNIFSISFKLEFTLFLNRNGWWAS